MKQFWWSALMAWRLPIASIFVLVSGGVWVASGTSGEIPQLAIALATLGLVALVGLGFLLKRALQLLAQRTLQRNGVQEALALTEARLRVAQSAAGIATVDWDIARDHAVWSSNFLDVFGLPNSVAETRTPYELFIQLVHPDDRARIDFMHLAILKTGGSFSEEFRIKNPQSDIRWIATHAEVQCDERGVPYRLIGSNFDITERRHNEDKLKQSLAILELANDAGQIGVWYTDIRANKGNWDERARKIFGIVSDKDNLEFKMISDIVHAQDLERIKSIFGKALKTGENFALECRINHPATGLRWVRICGQGDFDRASQRSISMTGIVFDITERRTQEKHTRLLMREITHRSKNLLAVIQAMARQTGNASTSLADFQVRFSARLLGLASSHDLLIDEDWLGANISDVVRSQIGHFIDLGSGRVQLAGDSLRLKPEAAQNIGLALHELSTNAAKYGALANAEGKIDISWALVMGDDDEGRLQIIWQETGGPTVVPREHRGFGSIVTERIVARALEGKVALAFAPEGVTWTLDIPATFVLEASRPQDAAPAV